MGDLFEAQDGDALTGEAPGEVFERLALADRGIAIYRPGPAEQHQLGVLSFTSEYATGQIRTTFAAVPQRLAVLTAKAGVIGVIAPIFGEALAFASFLVS